MNITGSRDGKVFFIDDDKVIIDGKMYYEKVPQNLPKADAYSLLAEVLQFIKQIEPNECGCIKKGDLISKLRKHFS